MHVIYVFGDSITYGAWDIGESGWTSKLRSYLDKRNDVPTYYFYPLGIHGETTAGLVKRFDNELEARRRHDDTTYTFIFAYGANDATWLTNEQRFKEPLEGYEKNLTTILDKIRGLTDNIFFIDITPVNEEFSANLVKKNKSCLNEYIDLYNTKLEGISSVAGASIIRVNDTFKQAGISGLFVPDGLHPNEAGHEIIFQQVRKSINPLLDNLESS